MSMWSKSVKETLNEVLDNPNDKAIHGVVYTIDDEAQSVSPEMTDTTPSLDVKNSDPVNPAHYQGFSNGSQVIDITENLTFNAGNAVKYLARATRLDGKIKGKREEDLRKAAWYLRRELERWGIRESPEPPEVASDKSTPVEDIAHRTAYYTKEPYKSEGYPFTPQFRDDVTVRLLHHYGSEKLIADAARVSTKPSQVLEDALGDAETSGQFAKERLAQLTKDTGLVRRLIKDGHGTPLEYPEFIFYLEVPIFVSRQIVKYRLSTINEQSGRYSVLPPVFYLPNPNRPMFQVGKQMDYTFKPVSEESEAEKEIRKKLTDSLEKTARGFALDYTKVIEAGVSREVARMGMPVHGYTSMHIKLNLRQVLHFIAQRVDIPTADRPSHGQFEIEQVALGFAHTVQELYPNVWQAFVESGYKKI